MIEKTTKTATIITVSELATDYRLHKLSQTLAKSSYSCTFVCRKHSKHLPYTNKDNKIHYLNTIWQSSPLFYLIYNLRIFIFLLFHKTDIVVSVDLDTLVGSGFAKKFKRFKLLFDSHEYFTEAPEINHKKWVKRTWLLAEKLLIGSVDIGITVCQPIADIFKQKYNKDFFVVRNAPMANRKSSAKRSRIKTAPFTILYQGAVNYGRALEQLIAAMDLIPEVQLIIVGDGDLFNVLKPIADKKKNVIMTGKVPFDQLPSYTAQADLGIALLEDMGLNNYYALPNRLFDSLHAGLPMLGINFPEIKRFIEEHQFGMTIDNIEPQSIAQAIESIINNPLKLNEWRKNALKARINVNWENETKPLSKHLRDILSD